MFNEFGIVKPQDTETLKYIKEFNQLVHKAIENGETDFYIDEDYQRKTLYNFVVSILNSDKYKHVFEDFNFDFHHGYIYVTW